MPQCFCDMRSGNLMELAQTIEACGHGQSIETHVPWSLLLALQVFDLDKQYWFQGDWYV